MYHTFYIKYSSGTIFLYFHRKLINLMFEMELMINSDGRFSNLTFKIRFLYIYIRHRQEFEICLNIRIKTQTYYLSNLCFTPKIAPTGNIGCAPNVLIYCCCWFPNIYNLERATSIYIDWLGKGWPMVACPFRALVVLYRIGLVTMDFLYIIFTHLTQDNW